MLPEEWPIAAPAADRNAPARHAGRDRLGTVRVDFFLNPGERLTEQERALMTAMLHCLVDDVADEIRSALPKGWAPANDESNLGLIEALTAAGLLDEPALMALLLRRADEERIAAGAKSRSGRREARVLQGLVSHENGAIAAAAMSLILARGRRRDRFGQCLIDFDDLAESSAEALVHGISAALRHDLAATHGSAAADQALGEITDTLLDKRNPDLGVDALTYDLAALLDQEGALGDALILGAAEEGEMAFVAEALARRAGISGAVAIEELLSGSEERLVALFRAAGLPRQLTARLLAGVGDLLGLADAGHAIASFDRMSDEQVEAARAWLAADPAYRSALATLGNRHG